VDLEDRGKDFLLTAELPGFKKEDVDVQISEDSVEIKAACKWKRDDSTKSYVHRERGSRSFYRIIRLPEEVKADATEANLKDGVLEVILPKKAPKAKKKVTVK
jgi:HSP20 family protein